MVYDPMTYSLLSFVDGRIDGNSLGPAGEGTFLFVKLIYAFENFDERLLKNILYIGLIPDVSPHDSPKDWQQVPKGLPLCSSVSSKTSLEPFVFLVISMIDGHAHSDFVSPPRRLATYYDWHQGPANRCSTYPSDGNRGALQEGVVAGPSP